MGARGAEAGEGGKSLMGRCQLIFEEKTTLNYYYISGVGWRVCDTSSC